MKKVPEAEQKHKSRKIGDLFSDYKTNSNIEDAEIARMNLLKKIYKQLLKMLIVKKNLVLRIKRK